MESSKSSSSSDSDQYTTVWSSPPKKPSGRTKFRETRQPVYKGVRRRGTSDRWVCEVRNPNNKSRIWLGTFPTADMAARAHDVAMMALHGRSACLNFADSAWLIKVPESFSSVNEIKKAAVEAAMNFRYRKTEDAFSTSSSSESASMSTSSDEVASKDNCMIFDLEEGLEMDLGSYYASLAEGLLMEPPRERYCDLGDDEWGDVVVSLWS